jgi:hypothetical protein
MGGQDSTLSNVGMGSGTATAAGAGIGTAITPGVGTIVGAGIGGAIDLITYFMNRVDQKKAEEESKAIDTRNFEYGKERDAFSENMQNKTFALGKQAQAFNQKQTVAGNVMGINKEMIQKMTDAINNNESLKNTVIGRWGA